jgi:hypothetical protein
VDAALEDMKSFFPAGLKAEIPYDTTPFVRVSIKGVVQTLIEAIVLVFVVMYLFLQNFRATLIPTIAVPVVLLGTFGVLAMLGFSVNMLTMFAMVLAIGLLVDDAIVVVENVERIMSEEGLSPLEATRKSMGQITGALVGIGLVLSAVFVPMAFMSGSTGVIYRQFSATIVSAMALSVLVAIVLTPALCATMLKPLKKGEHHVAHRAWPVASSMVQPWLRPHQRKLPARRARHHPPSVALHGHRGGAVRADGRAVRAPAQLVPAQRRPGRADGAGAGAGRCHPGTHAGIDRGTGKPLPAEREGCGGLGVLGAGLQLRRHGPERGHGLRQAEGLERA